MSGEINASTRLKDIMREFPELIDYLLDMGLCGCGDESLNWTVARAAAEKGIEQKMMLDELQKRIRK